MNFKDLVTIQEAYLNIYSDKLTEADTWNPSSDSPRKEGIINTRQSSPGYKLSPNKKWTPPVATPGQYLPQAKKEKNKDTQMSNYEYDDIFDFIMEYLISEGYTDTNKGALVIMANMSEEWRESICEEILDEMRKEDKVKGKKKTPLHITTTTRSAQRTPEGSERKWEIKTTEHKKVNPVVAFKRGYGSMPVHPHGEGGIHRGKKKKEQVRVPEGRPNVYQRKRELAIRKGATRYGIWGDAAVAKETERNKKNFKTASQKWSSEGK